MEFTREAPQAGTPDGRSASALARIYGTTYSKMHRRHPSYRGVGRITRPPRLVISIGHPKEQIMSKHESKLPANIVEIGAGIENVRVIPHQQEPTATANKLYHGLNFLRFPTLGGNFYYQHVAVG
jgi:hypothetical protein